MVERDEAPAKAAFEAFWGESGAAEWDALPESIRQDWRNAVLAAFNAELDRHVSPVDIRSCGRCDRDSARDLSGPLDDLAVTWVAVIPADRTNSAE